jgi:hypothetical protein
MRADGTSRSNTVVQIRLCMIWEHIRFFVSCRCCFGRFSWLVANSKPWSVSTTLFVVSSSSLASVSLLSRVMLGGVELCCNSTLQMNVSFVHAVFHSHMLFFTLLFCAQAFKDKVWIFVSLEGARCSLHDLVHYMGDFRGISNPHTINKRMSLSLSKTIPTISMDKLKVMIKPDISAK